MACQCQFSPRNLLIEQMHSIDYEKNFEELLIVQLFFYILWKLWKKNQLCFMCSPIFVSQLTVITNFEQTGEQEYATERFDEIQEQCDKILILKFPSSHRNKQTSDVIEKILIISEPRYKGKICELFHY